MVRELFGYTDASAWRDVSLETGRAPFDTKYCAARHALFESFASLERLLAPAYRHLRRARRDVVMSRDGRCCSGEVESVAYQTAVSAFSVAAAAFSVAAVCFVRTSTRCFGP